MAKIVFGRRVEVEARNRRWICDREEVVAFLLSEISGSDAPWYVLSVENWMVNEAQRRFPELIQIVKTDPQPKRDLPKDAIV
jgi:hypothetical protein